MNLAVWIIAILLAAVFLFAGAAKLFIPRARLAQAPGGDWVNAFSPGLVKTLGAVEVLGAIGLILPAALDIAPVLVPLAAVGIVLLMTGAVITRLRHGGTKAIPIDTAYLAMAAAVAVARFGPESFGS